MEAPLSKVRISENRERDLLWLFDIGIILKGVNGLLEVIAAILITTVPPRVVLSIADFATGGELSQEPDDLVARLIHNAAHSFSVSNHLLVSVYLGLHGAIKMALVAGIFAGRKIAYPLFMIALALFGSYELYAGISRAHPLLGILGVFDFLLIVLTMYEYRRRYPQPA